jgi:micrococcal nuclease
LSERRRPLLAWVLVALGAALAVPAPSLSAAPEVLRGTIVTVYDGDTVRVRLEGRRTETVRLIGVDSPELDDPREPARLLAFLAKRFAFGRLYQKKVDLLPGPETRDAYGRLLAFVRMEDGSLFNVALVREGFAHAFLKFPFDEDLRRKLREAEAEARRDGRGLWMPEPYPVIAAAAAATRVGDLVTVEFRCLRSTRRGGFQILEAEGAAFEAAIPLEVFRSLPGSLDLAGRQVAATGLVELYKGRPQIMIGVAAQLKTVERR